ncbi:MAG: hypothetical protein HUK21_08275 [Fibrobacteraceae bacterium]|nr:hypothetical protein [Fibrobacteraceae bacterium]
MSKVAFLLALCPMLLWVSCTTTDEVAGGVDEQTNTLAGVVVDTDGKPVSGVRVLARSFDCEDQSFINTTDSKGEFRMPLKRTGNYGVSGSKEKLSFYQTVEYRGDSISINPKLVSSIDFKGSINLRKDTTTAGIVVSLPGSPWVDTTDQDGNFTFKNMPVGTYPLVAESPDPTHYVSALYSLKFEKDGSSFVGPFPINYKGDVAKMLLGDTSGIENTDQDSSDVASEPYYVSTLYHGYVGNENSYVENNLEFPLSAEYGLLSWWTMDYLLDSKNGTKLLSDARGRTEQIVVYGKAELTTGISGNALALTEASQYGVLENDRYAFDNATAMYVEAWVYVDSLENAENYRKNIVGKLGFGSEEDRDVFSLAIVKGECGADKASFAFFVADGSGDSLSCDNAAVSKASLEFGKWVYLTGVWNGEKINLYQNGTLYGSHSTTVEKIGTSSEPIFFGKEDINLKLDDVRLGRAALEAVDVLYRYYLQGGVK